LQGFISIKWWCGANNHPLLLVEATIIFDYLLKRFMGKAFSEFCLQKKLLFSAL